MNLKIAFQLACFLIISVIRFRIKQHIFMVNIYIFMFAVDEIQVASYKMLGSLYTLGTDGTLTGDR